MDCWCLPRREIPLVDLSDYQFPPSPTRFMEGTFVYEGRGQPELFVLDDDDRCDPLEQP